MTAAIKYGTLIADKININKKDFLIPIIKQTAQNCITAIEKNEPIPLTGPIVRNDLSTIQQHLDALSIYPNYQEIYSDFAKIITNLYITKNES